LSGETIIKDGNEIKAASLLAREGGKP